MKYESSLKLKLIYVFRINDQPHKGCLKIGEATCENILDCGFQPNSKALNAAAHRRINQYTQTAGIKYELLYTELALYSNGKNIYGFNDKEVHAVLERSGIKRKVFDVKHQANEWFITDLETVKKAIKAVKQGQTSLRPSEISQSKSPIVFRPEQLEAINQTVKQFKQSNQMLWNAKMRFGKTLTALQVVKEIGFKRTLILTHRPVVNASWFEDFGKIFYDRPDYAFGSKQKGEKFVSLEERAKEDKINYVYFASMQDLRGSEQIGGNFDKNHEIFSTNWSLLIVDEAHEGIETSLGRSVLEELIASDTKVLRLSGTPFNLLKNFKQDEIYTWDYVMEQRAKADWDKIHFGDSNPYASLPRLNIFTYDLGKLLHEFAEEDIAFNFREFFKVAQNGRFFYEKEIVSFLNLLTNENKDSCYPFASDEYRKIFRHTLWVLPGVKEAKALKKLLTTHPVFQFFTVVNVAGDGDEESDDALTAVKNAIGDDPEQTRTITLTCGRLTTGVSVPAWTAVLMLSGSYSTAASTYMQTIFRVQTPATINGKIKEECYVFDFAPDRTLKVLAETAKISSKAGKTSSDDRRAMGDFLNFCPVISISGSTMEKFDVSRMLEELKKAYVERVVRNGFEDNKLYNDELLKLTELELEDFKKLKETIGATKSVPQSGDIDINNQGLTKEEYEEIEKLKVKPKKALSDEEKKRLEELRLKTKNRDTAISILRGLSIRMPLLIFGAELDDDADITIDNFANIVDQKSWDEFMPNGVTKDHFEKFKKYYDPDIFRAAGKRIRTLVRLADKCGVEERIQRITDLFSTFKNPDKETVLTPWRVVNLHMGMTVGGYNFYTEDFKNSLESPRFVDSNQVAAGVFGYNSRILEINSKSGLYPLYLAYNFYRNQRGNLTSDLSVEDQNKIWDQVIANNIFVICKTPMAKSITRRTLVGFREVKVNSKYFEDLVSQIKNKPASFIEKVGRGKTFWKANEDNHMKFSAVVGNPPYQIVVAQKDTKNGQKRSSSIFHHFQNVSDKLGTYTSLIYPGARWIHRAGKGLDQFGRTQINDPHLKLLVFFPDAGDIFPDVAIADGLSIVMKDMTKTSSGFEYIYSHNGENTKVEAVPPGENLFILNPKNYPIGQKLEEAIHKYSSLHDSILSQKLFSIESDFVERNSHLVREYKDGDQIDPSTEIKLFTNDKAGKSGRCRWYVAPRSVIVTGTQYLNKWKVIVSSANAGGQKRSNQISIADNLTAFGRARIALKTFETKEEAENFLKYATSDLIRFAFLLTDESLTSLAKRVPDIMDYSSKNTLVDFEKDVDKQLYKLFGITEREQKYISEFMSNRP